MRISPKLMTLPVILIFALAAVLCSSVSAGDPKQGLEKAYVSGELTVQDAVAKKDSVFALINERYQAVKPILQNSCFDCHSQLTDYPWYHKLPIIGGMIDEHVSEAREYLDMTQGFPFAGKVNSLKLLEEIKDEIKEGEMPIFTYRLLHWGKLIEGDRRDSLFSWIDETTLTLNAFFDSIAADSSSQSEDDSD